MKYYELNGDMVTISELSEMSGIAPATIRDRLRRGYSVEQAIKEAATSDSVEAFCNASYYMDWVGMPVSYLYEIYWKWCIEHGYKALQIQGFSRQLLGLYPTLKTVPTKKKDKCYRVVRLK
jgi:hypothetical protein